MIQTEETVQQEALHLRIQYPPVEFKDMQSIGNYVSIDETFEK